MNYLLLFYRKNIVVWSYYFDLGKINGQRKKKEKSGFISNFYGVLSGALKYALYPANYIKDNPMLYVSLPKYDEIRNETKDLKIITLKEFHRIIQRFPSGSNFYIPLQIGFNTGMRGGEIVALT